MICISSVGSSLLHGRRIDSVSCSTSLPCHSWFVFALSTIISFCSVPYSWICSKIGINVFPLSEREYLVCLTHWKLELMSSLFPKGNTWCVLHIEIRSVLFTWWDISYHKKSLQASDFLPMPEGSIKIRYSTYDLLFRFPLFSVPLTSSW